MSSILPRIQKSQQQPLLLPYLQLVHKGGSLTLSQGESMPFPKHLQVRLAQVRFLGERNVGMGLTADTYFWSFTAYGLSQRRLIPWSEDGGSVLERT